MTLFSWLSSAKTRSSQHKRPRFRLSVAELEDRSVPSTLHVGASEPYHTIEAAVLAANPGDTIKVDPGNYREQVLIDQNSGGTTLNNLTLKGSGSATILAPAVMTGTQAIVEIKAAQNVTLTGLTISGPSTGIQEGIYVDGGASANITNDHITQIHDSPVLTGDQNGVAIQVGLDFSSINTTGSATIVGNTIDNYQKGGIVVDGPASSALITGNDLDGVGPTAVIAQNGIQISSGASSQIVGNNVAGNIDSNLANPASVGILLLSPGCVSVLGNEVVHNDYGIYAFGSTGNVNISFNDVRNSTNKGIILDTTSDAYVLGNTLSKNGSGGTGDGGILLAASTGNFIVGNTSSDNNGDGIYVDAASAGNTLFGNTFKNNSNLDAEDFSIGSGTSGTANLWKLNRGKTSSPAGLVKK